MPLIKFVIYVKMFETISGDIEMGHHICTPEHWRLLESDPCRRFVAGIEVESPPAEWLDEQTRLLRDARVREEREVLRRDLAGISDVLA